MIADCRQLKDCDGGSCPEIHLTFLGDAYQSAERSLGLTGSIIRQIISFDPPFTILTKPASIERDIDLPAPYRKFWAGFAFAPVDQKENHGLVDKLLWICPRMALQVQGKRNFIDPFFRAMFTHNLSIRSTNMPAPGRTRLPMFSLRTIY